MSTPFTRAAWIWRQENPGIDEFADFISAFDASKTEAMEIQ